MPNIKLNVHNVVHTERRRSRTFHGTLHEDYPMDSAICCSTAQYVI